MWFYLLYQVCGFAFKYGRILIYIRAVFFWLRCDIIFLIVIVVKARWKVRCKMYCHKCGKKIDANDVFCPFCGTRIDPVESPKTVSSPTKTPELSSTKKSSKIWLVILLIIGFVAGMYFRTDIESLFAKDGATITIETLSKKIDKYKDKEITITGYLSSKVDDPILGPLFYFYSDKSYITGDWNTDNYRRANSSLDSGKGNIFTNAYNKTSPVIREAYNKLKVGDHVAIHGVVGYAESTKAIYFQAYTIEILSD